MNLGNKIMTLRKKNNMSQEELAEKVGVTRQTISKWELEETSPDITQAKTLSNIFKVSLDELVSNDLNSIIVEKVSNTEKLAGIIINILKVFGILILAVVLLMVFLIIIFSIDNDRMRDNTIVGKYEIKCTLDNEDYVYEVEYNTNYQIINAGGDAFISNHIDVERVDDANKAIARIEDYFKDHNGTCISNQNEN